MAIVKMNEFTLFAFESQKDKVLEALQGFEAVQFINLQSEKFIEDHKDLDFLKKDAADSECMVYEENLSKIKFALDFLKGYVPQKSGIKALIEEKKVITYDEIKKRMKSCNWQKIYEDLKNSDEKLNSLLNKKAKYQAEINSLSLWEKFDASNKDLKALKLSSYFLGSMPKQYEEEFNKEFNKEVPDGYLEIFNRDNQNIYIFALVLKENEIKGKEIIKKYGYSEFTFNYDEKPKDIIKNYSDEIPRILSEVELMEEEIRKYRDTYEELQIAYDYYNNLKIRDDASDNFLKTDKIIAISGWTTKESDEKLIDLIESVVGNDYYIEFSDADDKEIENVPIKLKNNGFASSFESLVEMYSMPVYSEIDPTPILSVFYFIFFGMMLSDAGYGLIMVIASIIVLSKIKDKEKRKTFKLYFYAGISTIIWGAIYGGWFGDLLPKYFGINIPYLLNPATNITQIFVMSLVFGIIHIFVGLGIKAYILIRDGRLKDAVYDVFTWYITLIGSILLIIGVGGSLGKIMLIAGLVGLLLTQGREAPTLIGKIGGGIYGVYGITGYLGDVVSYSRLLALGLATGFIANALNLIVSLFPKPISYVFAPVLFIGLHLFNLLINALGSYVHAARLQYLEFFGKFYQGGGVKFTPFKTSDKFIRITK